MSDNRQTIFSHATGPNPAYSTFETTDSDDDGQTAAAEFGERSHIVQDDLEATANSYGLGQQPSIQSYDPSAHSHASSERLESRKCCGVAAPWMKYIPRQMNWNTFWFLNLLVWNTLMIIFVVIEGDTFCNYQYGFSMQLALYGAVFFLVLYIGFNHRLNVFRRIHPDLNIFSFRYSGLCGMFWAMNYVMLLQANPYTPGFYQTIFTEMNLVLVLVVSRFFLGMNYYHVQLAAVGLVLIGGVIPLFSGIQTGSAADVGWYFMFLLGALAIGMATLVTDNAMRTITRTVVSKDGKTSEKLPVVSILQFSFATNIWALLFTCALFVVPLASYREDFYTYTVDSLACIFGGQCQQADNLDCATYNPTLALICIWALSTFSFVSAAAVAYLNRVGGAVYATLGLALSPAIATVIFMIQPIMGNYYVPVEWYAIVAAIITFVGVILYKTTTMTTRLQPKNFQSKTLRFCYDLSYNLDLGDLGDDFVRDY